ncbi:tetratricopeptide repeat protein [candidate division KSB1 bacterium]|nr:tetratricopeptide repeat protein [candidate division KSB1 bacterium]
MLKMRIKILLLAGLMSFTGCASTYYSRGHKAIDDERYADAVRELKQAVADEPTNIDAIRDLGIAIYNMGNLNLSFRLLNVAKMRRPDDPVIAYYIGRIYEDNGQYDKAIDMYKIYINLSPLNSFRQEIEDRLLVLVRQQMRKDLRNMLTRESQLEVAAIPDNAVAVLYFLNLNNDKVLSPLQKGLTEMLITDLSQVNDLVVIERARLQSLMEEMGLGLSGLVGSANAPRLGKLLGASKIVQGGLVQLAGKQLRIDAGYTDIKHNRTGTSGSVTGAVSNLFKMEKDVVFKVIDGMGIQLSSEERKAIEKVPTSDLLAFMYYCKALDQEDRGLYNDAANSYNAALQKDPGFEQAVKGAQRVKAFSEFKVKPPKPKFAALTAKRGEPAGKRGKAASQAKNTRQRQDQRQQESPMPLLGSRLDRTALNVNSGFMPGIESREPATEENVLTFGSSNPIFIRIPIPLKQ